MTSPVGEVRVREEVSSKERGQLLAMTCVFMTMFVALAGLVADGGRYLDSRQAAQAEAEQAARAGADSLDLNQLRSGNLQLDSQDAVSIAESFMTEAGHPGVAWADADSVHVQISYSEPTQLLGIVGVHSLRIVVTASATNIAGIASGD